MMMQIGFEGKSQKEYQTFVEQESDEGGKKMTIGEDHGHDKEDHEEEQILIASPLVKKSTQASNLGESKA